MHAMHPNGRMEENEPTGMMTNCAMMGFFTYMKIDEQEISPVCMPLFSC